MNGTRPAGWIRQPPKSLRERQPAQGPMIGKIAGMGLHSGLTIETTLDPAIQPFLYDHQIDGTPVLPGVMGIEAFAEAALCMLPGWHVEAIEEVNFLAPFKFYRNEPRTVTIEARFHPQGDALVADCRLIGRRTLPNQPEPQVTTHFTARVRLNKTGARSADRARAWACRADPSLKPPTSIAFTSTGPRTRFWSGRGGMEIGSSARWPRTCPVNHHPPNSRR